MQLGPNLRASPFADIEERERETGKERKPKQVC